LLGAIAGDRARGATGRVVQSGETIEPHEDDLVVHPVNGRLVVESASALAPDRDARIVADGVWAHLAGAGHLHDEERGLLERVDREEVRA
jgi:hypothetical protein